MGTFDPEESFKQDRNPETKMVTQNDFKSVISKDIQAIDPEKEFERLLKAIPKVTAKKSGNFMVLY